MIDYVPCLHLSNIVNFNLKAARERVKDREEQTDKPGLVECKVRTGTTSKYLISDVSFISFLKFSLASAVF